MANWYIIYYSTLSFLVVVSSLAMALRSFLKITSGNDPARRGLKWVWFGYAFLSIGSLLLAITFTETAVRMKTMETYMSVSLINIGLTTPAQGNTAWCILRLSSAVLLYALLEVGLGSLTLCHTSHTLPSFTTTAIRRTTYGICLVLVVLSITIAAMLKESGKYFETYSPTTNVFQEFPGTVYNASNVSFLIVVFNVVAVLCFAGALFFCIFVGRQAAESGLSGSSPRLMKRAATVACVRAFGTLIFNTVLNMTSLRTLAALLIDSISLAIFLLGTFAAFYFIYDAGHRKDGGLWTPYLQSEYGRMQQPYQGLEAVTTAELFSHPYYSAEVGEPLPHEVHTGQHVSYYPTTMAHELEPPHVYGMAQVPHPTNHRELGSEGAVHSELPAVRSLDQGSLRAT